MALDLKKNFMYCGPVSARHCSSPALTESIAPAWHSSASTGGSGPRRSVTPSPHGPQRSGGAPSNGCGESAPPVGSTAPGPSAQDEDQLAASQQSLVEIGTVIPAASAWRW